MLNMNQHYVPRAYLKNFANKKGKEFFIDVYDRTHNRYFKTNIKNICSEVDLYTLDEGNEFAKDLFAIEKIYANGIEPLYLNAYKILTDHSIFQITDLQRAEILISIFQFYLRNPKLLRRSLAFHKNEIRKQCKKAKEQGIKGITYLNEDFPFSEFEEPQIVEYFERKITKEYKEKHIGGLGELGTFHEYAKLEISVIRDNSEFFTSDNPLVFQDHLTEDEHPLSRSKEFVIALNKKVALRLYHDNTKHLNTIYRCFIPNGSAASINNLILEQSSRFVMASKETIAEYKKINDDFLQNTSLELKMDAIRQIVTKFPETPDNKASREILLFYLKRYDSQGTLTDEEEYQMMRQINDTKADFIKRRIW